MQILKGMGCFLVDTPDMVRYRHLRKLWVSARPSSQHMATPAQLQRAGQNICLPLLLRGNLPLAHLSKSWPWLLPKVMSLGRRQLLCPCLGRPPGHREAQLDVHKSAISETMRDHDMQFLEWCLSFYFRLLLVFSLITCTLIMQGRCVTNTKWCLTLRNTGQCKNWRHIWVR